MTENTKVSSKSTFDLLPIHHEVAQALSEGLGFKDIHRGFGVDKDTLLDWLQEAEFQALIKAHYKETELVFNARLNKAVVQAVGNIQNALQCNDASDKEMNTLCVHTINLWQKTKELRVTDAIADVDADNEVVLNTKTLEQIKRQILGMG